MAKKASFARNKGGRNTAKFVPLNPLGEDKIGFSETRRMVMRFLGILIVLLVAGFFLMASGGGGAYLHVYWPVIGPCLLFVAAVLLCVIVLLWLRGIAASNWSRLGFTCLMVFVLCAVAAGGISTVWVGYTYGEIPVAYLTSPEGERIVIMRSANPDKDPNIANGYTTQYTGYEMINSQFYLYVSTMAEAAVWSDVELEPEWAVEWLENDDARLYLPDYEGQPHSETRVIVFDLENMEESLEEKGDLLLATPVEPAQETEEQAEPTVAPSVDPFAY